MHMPLLPAVCTVQKLDIILHPYIAKMHWIKQEPIVISEAIKVFLHENDTKHHVQLCTSSPLNTLYLKTVCRVQMNFVYYCEVAIYCTTRNFLQSSHWHSRHYRKAMPGKFKRTTILKLVSACSIRCFEQGELIHQGYKVRLKQKAVQTTTITKSLNYASKEDLYLTLQTTSTSSRCGT